jgi:hypothetical protein
MGDGLGSAQPLYRHRKAAHRSSAFSASTSFAWLRTNAER